MHVINAHATSTEAGDLSETRAIKQLFGEAAYRIPVTANKSMTGHMLGAAGGAEAISLIQTLQHGIIPPTINQEQQDPDCDLDYVPNEAREAELKIGMSNSFGFGGHNAVVVFANIPPDNKRTAAAEGLCCSLLNAFGHLYSL